MSGEALAMKLKLRTLMQRHRIQNQPCKIPLTAPTDSDVILEGYASNDAIDLDRVKMRPYCFGYPLLFRRGYPVLLYKHFPDQIAGKIDTLQYDDFGSLMCWAVVTHDLAKRCGAFSIGAKVLDYEIKDADSPNFYAQINQAELTEISLTDCPSNPQALVYDRHRYPPTLRTTELLIAKMQCLQKLTTLMKEVRP